MKKATRGRPIQVDGYRILRRIVTARLRARRFPGPAFCWPAFPHDKAVEIIAEGSGTHFEPVIVDVFLSIESTFKEIASKYKDEGFDEDSFQLKASGEE